MGGGVLAASMAPRRVLYLLECAVLLARRKHLAFGEVKLSPNDRSLGFPLLECATSDPLENPYHPLRHGPSAVKCVACCW